MIKLLYKPVGLLINWLYGVLAGAVVNRVWTSAIRADDAPKATDAQRRWKSFQMRAHATGIGSGGCADGSVAASTRSGRAAPACRSGPRRHITSSVMMCSPRSPHNANI